MTRETIVTENVPSAVSYILDTQYSCYIKTQNVSTEEKMAVKKFIEFMRKNINEIKDTEHLDNVRRSHKKEGEIVGVYKTVNNTYYSHLDYNSKTYNRNFKTFEEAKLYRYILELNYCREFSPQIDLIKNEYPHLLKVLDLPNMKINEDIKRVKEVLSELEIDSHCPCMIVKNENTICPCLPCRNKNICICELFKNINVEESEVV